MKWSSIQKSFFRPVDASSLALFRILFGLLLLLECVRLWDELGPVFCDPVCHFPLDPWGMCLPFSPFITKLEWAVLTAAATAFTIGLRPRAAALVLFVLYGHFFFMERSNYNNHYYLAWMLCGFFVFSDSSAKLSVDVIPTGKPRTIPFWNLALFRGQFMLLYFYGGLAKMNPDWLQGQPLIMDWQDRFPSGSNWYWAAVPLGLAMSYIGLLLDLAVGFTLLFRRTRWASVALLVLFHLSNKLLFGIGIFPWLGISATLLFFPPESVCRLVARIRGEVESVGEAPGRLLPKRLVIGLLVTHFSFQLLFPFRHHLIRGNLHWTWEHYFFSWTMKLDRKDGVLGVEVFDPERGEAFLVQPEDDLSALQIQQATKDPVSLWYYCRFLDHKARRMGYSDPRVHACCLSSLNGRPFQLFADPDVALNRQPRPGFGHADWILPLAQTDRIGIEMSQSRRAAVASQMIRELLLEREKERRLAGVDTSGYFKG